MSARHISEHDTCYDEIMASIHQSDEPKHSHYLKDVSHLNKIDVYRVLELFEVTDPGIQHAIKKLLVAGGRGVKDQTQDYQEAIDSIKRSIEMIEEDRKC